MMTAAPAFGQEKPALAQGGYKIAVVNRADIFAQYKMKADMDAKLEAERERLETQITEKAKALGEEARSINERREKNQLTEDEMTAWDKKFRETRIELEALKQNLQGDLDAMTKEAIREIAAKMQEEIVRIAQAGGYHLVLEADAEPSANSPVVYFEKSLDITSQVVINLNKSYTSTSARSADPATTTDKSKG
jgi:Skp family chaperone for outer membrane proteins